MASNWLVLADYLSSSLVLCPLVVFYWRSIWEMVLKYPPKGSPPWVWVSAIVGVRVAVCFLVPPPDSDLRPPVAAVAYLTSYTNVLQWHFLWVLMDFYVAKDTVLNVASAAASLALLVILKGVVNISATPFSANLDTDYQAVLSNTTFFKIEKKKGNTWIYLLDCVFSVCIIGTLVVFVWRGSWTLLDIYLYPENPPSSYLASLVIGYIMVGLTFASQPLAKAIVRKTSGLCRLMVVDLYLLFSFCGTINVWRGIWNNLNLYFLPGNVMLSCLLCHVGSFLLLVLINSSNSVMVRGVYIDAEEPGDQCVDFPCYYLRLFFQEKRKEKLLKKHLEGLKKGGVGTGGQEGEGLLEGVAAGGGVDGKSLTSSSNIKVVKANNSMANTANNHQATLITDANKQIDINQQIP